MRNERLFSKLYLKAITFKALAVVADTEGPCAPCGACRQVMVEFKIPHYYGKFDGDIKIVSMEELLPFSFSESDVIGK